jgi:hypothetical protein
LVASFGYKNVMKMETGCGKTEMEKEHLIFNSDHYHLMRHSSIM